MDFRSFGNFGSLSFRLYPQGREHWNDKNCNQLLGNVAASPARATGGRVVAAAFEPPGTGLENLRQPTKSRTDGQKQTNCPPAAFMNLAEDFQNTALISENRLSFFWLIGCFS